MVQAARARSTTSMARPDGSRSSSAWSSPTAGELHAHCYRMLGSLHDTEEAMQEAMLRAWRGLERFEGRSSLRSWLYRIATNTCLDTIARRKRRLLPEEYGPKADPQPARRAGRPRRSGSSPTPTRCSRSRTATPRRDASYEEREAVELAFVAAMQHLPPRQRAVLILREVLGFSAKEVGETLDTSVPSSTAPSSGPARSSRSASPTAASRSPCARSATPLKEIVEDTWRRCAATSSGWSRC